MTCKCPNVRVDGPCTPTRNADLKDRYGRTFLSPVSLYETAPHVDTHNARRRITRLTKKNSEAGCKCIFDAAMISDRLDIMIAGRSDTAPPNCNQVCPPQRLPACDMLSRTRSNSAELLNSIYLVSVRKSDLIASVRTLILASADPSKLQSLLLYSLRTIQLINSWILMSGGDRRVLRVSQRSSPCTN